MPNPRDVFMMKRFVLADMTGRLFCRISQANNMNEVLSSLKDFEQKMDRENGNGGCIMDELCCNECGQHFETPDDFDEHLPCPPAGGR